MFLLMKSEWPDTLDQKGNFVEMVKIKKGAETEIKCDVVVAKKKRRPWRQAVRNHARRLLKDGEVPAAMMSESGAQSNDEIGETTRKKKKRRKKKIIVLDEKEDVSFGSSNGEEKERKRKSGNDGSEVSAKKIKRSDTSGSILGNNVNEERLREKKRKTEEATKNNCKKEGDLTKCDVKRGKKSENVPKKFKKLDVVSRLDGAHFRHLNEKLYTTSSSEAKAMFDEDANAFYAYHKGFVQQVEKWPLNPVENVIMDLKALAGSSSIIADVGCGDAKIAKALKGTGHLVHSFDLVALDDDVIVADMSKLPLESDSVDMAIYCLSLMNTNLSQFMCEANRIIKIDGKLKICEVSSRFHSIANFISALEKMGFQLHRRKSLKSYFVSLTFIKKGKVVDKRPKGLVLRPCLYKKR